MIDLEKPESKAVRVLGGEAMSEPAGGRDFQIIQHDDRFGRRLIHGQKKRVLTLGGIGRAIDQDQPGALQPLERFALRCDIKRLDGTQPIPAAGERDDVGKIRLALGDRAFELLGPA